MTISAAVAMMVLTAAFNLGGIWVTFRRLLPSIERMEVKISEHGERISRLEGAHGTQTPAFGIASIERK